ncbi:alpha/beta hydrolase [Aliidiomarina soli]|uniref:Alpha/beta hydrolase n=1 Tax=Aliidiomarina soli TaxID=1928574 RepID=A0A432WHZ2_9GAMM|nr:alpha/beta hydrolase [Aliidiomarina soli]RUO33375.1 alpha/beta hydrolase [Aliidiomarina soli]
MRRNSSLFSLFVVLFSSLLTGCSGSAVLNALTPDGSYNLESVPYGDHSRQQMDIYYPDDPQQRQKVVVFVYGGAWERGDKADFEFIGQAFARLGYITVIPDYRLYPEVEFPAFIDDVAKAVSQLEGAISASCPSAQSVILAGHSAGAHSAALVAADPQYLQAQGYSGRIGGAILMSGPYDLPLDHSRVADKFSQANGNQANPVALAGASMPSTLLLHGRADSVADPEHSERFAQRLAELGVPSQLHIYPRTRHVDLIASLGSPLRFLTPAYGDIQRFLSEQHLDDWCD